MSSHNVAVPSYAYVCAAEQIRTQEEEIARLKAQLAELKPVAEKEREREKHVKVRQHLLARVMNIVTKLKDMCMLLDINVSSIEVFGSVVYWLKCHTHPGWNPGDIDVRFGVEGYAEIRTFKKMLEAFHFLSKGAEMELTRWREIKTYTYNQSGRPQKVCRLDLCTREQGVEEKVGVDILLSHQLPPAESTLTAWSMMFNDNGEWILSDRSNKFGRSLIQFGEDAFDISSHAREVTWIAPLTGTYFQQRYLLSRFDKLLAKGVKVDNPPFRVIVVDRECSVCLSEKSRHIVYECGHTNCLDCAAQLREARCPECRKEIFPYLHPSVPLPEFTIRSLKETGVASAPAL